MIQLTNLLKNKTLILVSLLIVMILVSDSTFAATSGGGLPFDSWLIKIRNSVTGPFAFTAAILGLVGAGATLIFGSDMNGVLRTLLYIVLVLSLLVTAQNSLQAITGKSAEIVVNSALLTGKN